MPTADVNGISLHYEIDGASDAPPLLLVMGLAGQLITWPQAFVDSLVAAGRRVIRFDNRDIGLSTRMTALGRPDLLRAGIASTLRLPVRAPYRLDDMADDALGLLDALSIDTADVVGVSMGGMIAQLMAIRQSRRVRSLALLMTHSGNPSLPGARWPIKLRLIRRPGLRDREAIVRYSMRTMQMIGSPAFPTPDDLLFEQAARQYDRAHHPAGIARQTAAILAAPKRGPALKKLRQPTLIVHGKDDPLIPVAAAHELKKLIPHAELDIIDGMGHDLPPQLVARIAGRIDTHLRTASPA